MAPSAFHDPELLENIDHLESQLVSYESGLGQGAEDASQVQFIFRYAHNLKSSLGMLGFSESSALLHKVESCFDLVRNAKRRATLHLTKATLTVVDLVRENLAAPEGTPLPDTQAVLQILETFLAGLEAGAEEDLSVALPFPLSLEDAGRVSQALRAGQRLWVIDKLLTTNIDETVFGILPCFDQARSLGELVAYWPHWDQLPRDKAECVLRLLVVSPHEKAEFAKKLHDSFRPVREPAVQKTYLAAEVPSEYVSVLRSRNYRPADTLPDQGPVLTVVGLGGPALAAREGRKAPGCLVLAAGDFAAGVPERLGGLDAGADAVVTDALELDRELARLETLFFTGMGGSHDH